MWVMKMTLEQWLDYQLKTHPQAIAMGLERVREVARRLGLGKPASHVITVGGTNGKGSTVAFIESIARAGGLRVGAFTSPHLLRYNERIRVDGAEVDDATLVDAFERIESARAPGSESTRPEDATVPLTYFEFGTLAALLVFEQSKLDIAILEVGLGGKLDAVNIVDPDVAIITTVGVDHQEYLGVDREAIGADKAGILRPGKPCVFGERDPPSSVLRHAYEIGAFAIRAHADYLVDVRERTWTWREPGFEIDLPKPGMGAPAQIDNAAAAVAALRALPLQLPNKALVAGVRQARVAGRLQVLAESPQVVVDVAHNVQAAGQLAGWLRENPKPTRAVFSALKDKDIEGIVAELDGLVGKWYLTGIGDAGPRGLTGPALAERLDPILAPGRRAVLATVAEALLAARAEAGADERVLVFGSFHTVAEALKASGAERDRL